MAFSGTPAVQAFKGLLYKVLQANELGGSSPYSLLPPVVGSTTSGWTFGTPQFDVAGNPVADTLLANILLNATDSAYASANPRLV